MSDWHPPMATRDGAEPPDSAQGEGEHDVRAGTARAPEQIDDTPDIAVPDGLTEKQQIGYRVLAGGGTHREAARAAGVSTGAISAWKKRKGWEFDSAELARRKEGSVEAMNAANAAKWANRREREGDASGVAASEYRAAAVATSRYARARISAVTRQGPDGTTELVGTVNATELTRLAAAVKSFQGASSEAVGVAQLLSGEATERIEQATPSDVAALLHEVMDLVPPEKRDDAKEKVVRHLRAVS